MGAGLVLLRQMKANSSAAKIEWRGDRVSGTLNVDYKEYTKDGKEYSDSNCFHDYLERGQRSKARAEATLISLLESSVKAWVANCKCCPGVADFGAWDSEGKFY